MNLENLPILVVLFISVLGNNHTVSIAAMALLLIKLLGLHRWLEFVELNGVTMGVTILTAAVLVPLVSGRVDASGIVKVFKTPTGLLAVGMGVALAWVAGQGVSFMKASPENVTALLAGTLIGVCFFRGLAVGPLIAGGMVALLARFLKL